MSVREFFDSKHGFCYICGSILPFLKQTGCVKCYTCKIEYDSNVLGEEKVEYTIYFNTYVEKSINTTSKFEDSVGPIVDRKCIKCGCDKMSYITMQLRSADEGQTVFFTCVKCRYKESENS